MTANPTARTDACGAVRASLFYGAPILSESGACILPGRHKGDHEDAKGARWYRIPLVGGMDLCGEDQALPLAHKPAWSAEPSFLSPFCVLGEHPRCLDSEPRDTGVPGVHYLVCTCACHHPAPPPGTGSRA
ncbi:hypothetical protein ACFYXF_45105 [Streptomyces sp. NPDC002680]|uniref:hypothetical protein n=1 Tax=Streptomyces sp. NPDC002680 TaxID=3364659 RepID=UPI003685D69B